MHVRIRRHLRGNKPTKVMDGILCGPLSCGLILEQTKKEIFSQHRVSVQQDGPSWSDHINSVYVLGGYNSECSAGTVKRK